MKKPPSRKPKPSTYSFLYRPLKPPWDEIRFYILYAILIGILVYFLIRG